MYRLYLFPYFFNFEYCLLIPYFLILSHFPPLNLCQLYWEICLNNAEIYFFLCRFNVLISIPLKVVLFIQYLIILPFLYFTICMVQMSLLSNWSITPINSVWFVFLIMMNCSLFAERRNITTYVSQFLHFIYQVAPILFPLKALILKRSVTFCFNLNPLHFRPIAHLCNWISGKCKIPPLLVFTPILF